MRIRAALAAWIAMVCVAAFAGVLTSARAADESDNTCIQCHRLLSEERLSAPTRVFDQDIHAMRGLGCAGCHGGNPRDPDITAMDPERGFKPAPGKAEVAAMCVRCHSDAAYMKHYHPRPYVFSMAEFRTSVHYKHLAKGDLAAATCTDCHGVHGILPVKDPRAPVYPTNVPGTCGHCHNAAYMKGRKIPTDQLEKYRGSVHGVALLQKGDLSAPACNDCHGNHGAAPPQTKDIAFVCGNCHGREGELFTNSPVAAMMRREGRRACATCHGNHDIQHPTDDMLSVAPGALCSSCHTAGSPGDSATAVILPEFHGFKRHIAEADSLLSVADQLGMPTASGPDKLRAADDAIVNVRASIHSFNRKTIMDAIAGGNADAVSAIEQARAALRDWRIRRLGMVGALAVILVMIALLLARIRSMGAP